jgi:hypothetical protein
LACFRIAAVAARYTLRSVFARSIVAATVAVAVTAAAAAKGETEKAHVVVVDESDGGREDDVAAVKVLEGVADGVAEAADADGLQHA